MICTLSEGMWLQALFRMSLWSASFGLSSHRPSWLMLPSTVVFTLQVNVVIMMHRSSWEYPGVRYFRCRYRKGGCLGNWSITKMSHTCMHVRYILLGVDFMKETPPGAQSVKNSDHLTLWLQSQFTLFHFIHHWEN